MTSLATHIVISAHRGIAPMNTRAARVWMWAALRRLFPSALACVLMPDHIHLVARGGPAQVPTSLRRTLGQFQRVFFVGQPLWREPHLTPISTRKILGRVLMYLWLNPCAAGLHANPLSTEFSSFRELFGTVAHPWCETPTLARQLGLSPAEFMRQISQRLARDPRCGVEAHELQPHTRPPEAVGPSMAMQAVAAATRRSLSDVGVSPTLRKAVVQLHARPSPQQHARPDLRVAQALGVAPTTMYGYLRAPPSPVLPAARICLADPRLREELLHEALPIAA